jgi:hypothetical protein
VADNPQFAVRIVSEFESTATGSGTAGYVGAGSSYGTGGTLRHDMVTIHGAPIPPSDPPVINVQPTSQNLPEGDGLWLTVTADGTPPLSYQWYRDLVLIPEATQSSYAIGAVSTNETGNYQVTVSSPQGAVTSAVAVVFVYRPVTIVSPPTDLAVPADSHAGFAVVADAYPAPGYQWFFGGESLSGATSSSLILSNVDVALLGDYVVRVSNAYSAEVSAPATLSMVPTIVSPFAGATAIWGLDALLSLEVIGSAPLSCQWYQDGVSLAGATNTALLIAGVQFTNGGLYSAVVSSPYGQATNPPAPLAVTPAGVSIGVYGTAAGLNLTGAVGYPLAIEYIPELGASNTWLSVTNLTLQQPVELWLDTSVDIRSKPKRFYRVTPGS